MNSPAAVSFTRRATPARSPMLSKNCSSILRARPSSAAAAVKSSTRASRAMRWRVALRNFSSSYENRHARRSTVSLCRRADNRLLLFRPRVAESAGTISRHRRTVGRALAERAHSAQRQASRDHNTADSRAIRRAVSRHVRSVLSAEYGVTLHVKQRGRRSEFRGAADLGVWGRYETTGYATAERNSTRLTVEV